MASQKAGVAWWWVGMAGGVLALGLWTSVGKACPFCSAVSLTLGEEMKAADAVVLARIVELPPKPPAGSDTPTSIDAKPTIFEVVDVLKGQELLAEKSKLEVIYFGEDNREATFLILGADPASLAWGTPVVLPPEALDYVKKIPTLPEKGGDRLAFFQEYFDSPIDLLARDAHDEFAKAPYAEVKELKDRMHHDVLLSWVQNTEIPASRRRLYLTMLGICGNADDLPVLEGLIRGGDPGIKNTLDALIACYLTLKGPDGLPLVEDLFLKKQDCEFTDTYSAIVALRFHGQEEQIISRQRLVEAFRWMLDRPQYADLVIPDLARWEDWDSMDRLCQLFKDANDQTSWIRVPVIHYLKQCPRPEAAQRIEELAQVDPDAVRRASSFISTATGTAPVPAPGGDVTLSESADGSATDPAAASAATTPSEAATVPLVNPEIATPATAGDSPAAAPTGENVSGDAANPVAEKLPPAAPSSEAQADSSPPPGETVAAADPVAAAPAPTQTPVAAVETSVEQGSPPAVVWGSAAVIAAALCGVMWFVLFGRVRS